MIPPKPQALAGRVPLLRRLLMLRRDILSVPRGHFCRAWVADHRLSVFRGCVCTDPARVRRVLVERPEDFPRAVRLIERLAPLVGRSVLAAEGEAWRRQRRIVAPAFQDEGLRAALPVLFAAGQAAVARLGGTVEVEAAMKHASADAIFRALFSISVEDETAAAIFHQFREFQNRQPRLTLGEVLRLPRRRAGRSARAARRIRRLIAVLTEERAIAIAEGRAPDDLATRIMTTVDPASGQTFTTPEMIDQVALFLLAAHETLPSALAWALDLLATDPEVQDRLSAEAAALDAAPDPVVVERLTLARDVFREALRLYPPLPVMVRESRRPEAFGDRSVAPGMRVILSLWHLHRHEGLWLRPEAFAPDRWHAAEVPGSWIPFSDGPRACPGAALSMTVGPLILSLVARAFRIRRVEGREPVPAAYRTIRSQDGIWLRFEPRGTSDAAPG